MGHVVNPISFRLNKTKFCFNTWISTSKLRYTPLFLNDLSLNKFIYWYLSTFNGLLLRSNLLINNLKILRLNKNILININFSKIIEYKKKRKYIKISPIYAKNNKIFFNSKYVNPKHMHVCNQPIYAKYTKSSKNKYTLDNRIPRNSKTVIFTKVSKHNKLHRTNKFNEKKKLLQQLPKLLFYLKFKKYRILNHKFSSYRVLIKNKLKLVFSKKKRLKHKNLKKFLIKTWYTKKSFFFRKFFLYKKNYKYKKKIKKILNFFFIVHKWYFSKIFKNLHRWSSVLKLKKRKKRKLILFLKIFKFQLNNILKCFFNFVSKKFQINIFILKKAYYANILSKFIQTKLNQGFMLKYLTKKLNYKLNSRNNNILGYKLYYCGRSSKKLRNFPDMWAKGYLGLSNPMVPLEYSQIALWTKKGIVGLKIWLLKKKKIVNVFQ